MDALHHSTVLQTRRNPQQLATSRSIPYSCNSVKAIRRRDSLAVTRPGHRTYLFLVTIEYVNCLARCRIPCSNGVIFASGRDVFSVARPDDCVNMALMPRQSPGIPLQVRHIPDKYRSFCGRGGHIPTAWRQEFLSTILIWVFHFRMQEFLTIDRIPFSDAVKGGCDQLFAIRTEFQIASFFGNNPKQLAARILKNDNP